MFFGGGIGHYFAVYICFIIFPCAFYVEQQFSMVVFDFFDQHLILFFRYARDFPILVALIADNKVSAKIQNYP